jgi:UTP-glucose-1-phosphate uridylyltransferase
MTQPTLVVLAAGVGSRYGGLKQIDAMGVNGATIVDYTVFDAIRAGFGQVVFIIRKSIEADFKAVFGGKFEHLIQTEYVFQEMDYFPEGVQVNNPERTKPWGTTHALWCARKAVHEPFAVLNADDFYGRHSFELAAGFLNQAADKHGQYAMIGYRLDATLSDSGTVARGVCETNAAGQLTHIVEQTDIARQADGKIVCCLDTEPVYYLGNESVSMNFWCFTPDVFPLLEQKLKTFFAEKSNEPKAECLLPTTLAQLISEQKANVQVLQTTSNWIGVTYQEDKPLAAAAIRQLVERGDYPALLWQ